MLGSIFVRIDDNSQKMGEERDSDEHTKEAESEVCVFFSFYLRKPLAATLKSLAAKTSNIDDTLEGRSPYLLNLVTGVPPEWPCRRQNYDWWTKIIMELKSGLSAFVTGGASGIGRALCLVLAKKGIFVTVVDTSVEKGEEVASLSQKENLKFHSGSLKFPSAIFVRCDVSKQGEVAAAFEKHVEVYGGLDICINCADIETSVPFHEDQTDGSKTWRHAVDVNLVAVIDCTHKAIKIMEAAKKPGVVINLGSAYPMISDPIYSSSKGGVVMFTRSLSSYKEKGIRVNVLCPEINRAKKAKHVGFQFLNLNRSSTSMDTIIQGAFQLITDESKAGSCLLITNNGGLEYMPTSSQEAKNLELIPSSLKKIVSSVVNSTIEIPHTYEQLIIHTLTRNFRNATRIVRAPLKLPIKPDHVLLKIIYAGVNAGDLLTYDSRSVCWIWYVDVKNVRERERKLDGTIVRGRILEVNVVLHKRKEIPEIKEHLQKWLVEERMVSTRRKRINEEILVAVEGEILKLGIIEFDEDWYPFKFDLDDDFYEKYELCVEDEDDVDRVSETWVQEGDCEMEEGEISLVSNRKTDPKVMMETNHISTSSPESRNLGRLDEMPTLMEEVQGSSGRPQTVEISREAIGKPYWKPTTSSGNGNITSLLPSENMDRSNRLIIDYYPCCPDPFGHKFWTSPWLFRAIPCS
ncbi:unnamed protein product [Lactuca saligna]|uniref:Uncharacterized protein n=1 Tax=Lactuca saligna TaxID=75948 RepID=A0AA35ZLZ7_LACSI|nr:unnamed protein product [Lactuca saligna]